MRRKFWQIALPSVAVGLLLTTIFVGSIPGLHGDEAWVILRTVDMTHGARPFSGMNFYTGALNAYLAWPLLAASGYQFWALRVTSAIINALAVLLALDIVRTLHPDDPALWGWTAALWVTSVPFVLFTRFGVELSMLTPVLLLGAIWLLSVAVRAEAGAVFWLAGVGSGFMLAVAAYNHLVTFAVVAALLVGAFAGFGRALFRRRISWMVALGLAVGMIPTVIRLAQTGHHKSVVEAGSLPPSIIDQVSGTLAELIGMLPSPMDSARDFPAVVKTMVGMIDGGILFQRYTGERLVPVIPYFSAALLGLGLACLWRTRGRSFRPIDRAMLVAWLMMPIAILLILPKMGLGYFEFPALVAPYALVRFALPPMHERKAAPRYARIGGGVLAAVLVLQIGYLGVDYFWAFARSGGRPSWFDLGQRALETSDHFMRTDRLYQQLTAAGVHEVIATNMVGFALLAQDIPRHQLQWTPRDDDLMAAAFPRTRSGRVAIIGFTMGPSDESGVEDRLQNQQRYQAGDLMYVRGSGFDPNFLVFIYDRP